MASAKKAEPSARRAVYAVMAKPNEPLLGLGMHTKALIAAIALWSMPASADQPQADQGLKSPSEFMAISNTRERSRAIFTEIGKLLTNPRCMNCHPSGDHPLQGNDEHEHMPPVWRGDTGHLETNCSGCHTEQNFTLHEAASYKSVPGHARWGVAPLSMA